MINNIIGLDVFTSDGQKLSVKDFINQPRVGDEIELVHDIGYMSVHKGDSSECTSGLCDLQMEDIK